MSGIAGKLSFDRHEPLAVVDQMLEACRRPGDPHRDVFVAPGVALGWCGAAAGDPPRAGIGINERETVRVVADSAVTNAGQLRAELQRLDHRFRSHTDSELIAHAYEAWGPCCVARLRGPFACAIWDSADRRLVLARDHIGIHQVYFALLPDRGLVFGSRLGVLLRDPGVGRHWCPEALDAYFAVGYVPAPLTAYRRISKLEPAHVLVVDGRRLHLERYWDFPAATDRGPIEEQIASLDACVRSAVRRQVKHGRAASLLYSGGTASSVLLAAMPRVEGTVVTVGDDQNPADLARSDAAATHFGRTRELQTAASDIPLLVSEVAAHIEEPIADPGAIAQFAVCAAARRQTDTALAGHGASVLWAGCTRHHMGRVQAAARSWLRGPLARALGHAAGLWDNDHRRALYTRDFAWQVRDAHPFSRHLDLYASREAADPLDRTLYVEACTLLPDSVLATVAAVADAAGLHLHLPFLDIDAAACAAATPSRLKQHGGIGMYPLRRVLAQRLPDRLMPPEHPRPAPPRWLRQALVSMVPTLLLTPRFDGRGIVSRPALAQLWREHCSGRGDHAHRLWSLLVLELWFRRFLDGDAAEQPLEYAVIKAA